MENVKYIPGDLVEFCGKIQRIENIDVQTSYRVSIRLEHGWFVNKPEEILNFLKPVPLTTEILAKNGWKQTNHVVDKHGFEYYTFENEKSVDVEYYPKAGLKDSDCFSVFWGDAEIRPAIHYLHELQHVMFGLDCYVNLKV